jgi:hypothetical protein
MKCYNHPGSEAVGTCKYCCKGLCAACAKDSGLGLVCSQQCEVEVKMLRAMVERNRGMVPIAARSHLRNGMLLFAMALVFIGFGVALTGVFRIYMFAFGMVMILGGGFAVFNSRRIAKL